MRSFRILVGISIALGMLVVGFFFNQLPFVWGALATVATELIAEVIARLCGRQLTELVKRLGNFASPEKERTRVEADLQRVQLFFAKPEVLKHHTVAVGGVILVHLICAGILGLSATLPQFVVKMAPDLDKSIQALNVFLSWLGMLSYVMFLLGMWHGYRLWRDYDNVLKINDYRLKCQERLTKLR